MGLLHPQQGGRAEGKEGEQKKRVKPKGINKVKEIKETMKGDPEDPLCFLGSLSHQSNRLHFPFEGASKD